MTTPTAPADDITLPADQLPLIASTSPERIWLDVGEEAATHHTETRFRDLHEVTWSEGNASGYGVEYVRADRASPSRAAVQPAHSSLVADILKDCCECERPNHWDVETVELRVSDLTMILERHIEGKE